MEETANCGGNQRKDSTSLFRPHFSVHFLHVFFLSIRNLIFVYSLGGHPLGKEAARLVDEAEDSLRITSSSFEPDTFKEKMTGVRQMLRISIQHPIATNFSAVVFAPIVLD